MPMWLCSPPLTDSSGSRESGRSATCIIPLLKFRSRRIALRAQLRQQNSCAGYGRRPALREAPRSSSQTLARVFHRCDGARSQHDGDYPQRRGFQADGRRDPQSLGYGALVKTAACRSSNFRARTSGNTNRTHWLSDGLRHSMLANTLAASSKRSSRHRLSKDPNREPLARHRCASSFSWQRCELPHRVPRVRLQCPPVRRY